MTPSERRADAPLFLERPGLGWRLGGVPARCLAAAPAVQLVIVLGAKVPIILTSRADSVMAGLASCAVASLVAEARRRSAGKAVAG